MNQGFATVIGMLIAYLASFAGMVFAYFYYKKNKRQAEQKHREKTP